MKEDASRSVSRRFPCWVEAVVADDRIVSVNRHAAASIQAHLRQRESEAETAPDCLKMF